MQLIIAMHIAHDYTHYVQSRTCIDIQMTGRLARRHLVRNWTTGGRWVTRTDPSSGPSSFSQIATNPNFNLNPYANNLNVTLILSINPNTNPNPLLVRRSGSQTAFYYRPPELLSIG